MTEEEYFRKNYPDSCYGDKPLSPHWDFFQDGVEFGERQSEKRIEELEQNVDYYAKRAKSAESHIVRQNERIADLEKENAELKEEIKNNEDLATVAYMQGAERYKPKWHDLRKDPNDLPKEDCETVTLHESGNKNIIKWKYGNWTNAIIIPVIAWCEIPTFTDKE